MRTHLRDPQLELAKVAPVSPGLSLDEVFSDLGSEALEAFQELQARSVHPPRTILFAEGQTPAGIFFLHAGKVRLFMSGPAGERLISHTAQPGEILGVTEGISGDSHRMSAETLTPSEVGYINREAFLQFLRAHGVVAFRLVQLLSNKLDSRYERLRSLAVRRSGKLKR
jgi:CRP/FNR family transcriptional regulator, polysaccharide utilization system transcription regulator